MVHTIHSCRGTFPTTRGVNVVDSSEEVYLEERHIILMHGQAVVSTYFAVHKREVVLRFPSVWGNPPL